MHSWVDRRHSLDRGQCCPRRFGRGRSRTCRPRSHPVVRSLGGDACSFGLSLSIGSKPEHSRVWPNRRRWLGGRDLDRVLRRCRWFRRWCFLCLFMAWIGRRSGFIMRKGNLRPVCPLNRLWSPVVFIIVNVGPLGLCAAAIFLNSRRHVNTILLLQFFICQVLRWCRLGSYNTRSVSPYCFKPHGDNTYAYSYSRLDSDPVLMHQASPQLHSSSRTDHACRRWSLQPSGAAR